MGLLSGVLPAVYSASDALKRKVGGLLSDPVGTLQQHVGLLNDNARSFNQLHSKATQESVDSIKGGGSGFGPVSQQLAGKLADAYNPMGMVVWHGSPHKFSKFDSSKIGTGEGAQAYGHGLYLAQAPEVAKSYISSGGAKPTSTPDVYAADIVGMFGGEEKALRHLQNILPNQGETAFSGESRELISNAIDAVKSGAYKQNAGSLYKVDLPDDAIAKMLDWDKPITSSSYADDLAELYGESGKVRHYLDVNGNKRLMVTGQDGRSQQSFTSPTDAKKFVIENLTAADVYGALAEKNGAAKAAEILNARGIPGIRYLDGGSRGAGGGTSNFVVFPGNEGLLNILERNGQPIK